MIPRPLIHRWLSARTVLAGCAFILLLSFIGICTNLTINNRAGTRGAGLSGGMLWVAWRQTPALEDGGHRTYSPRHYIEETDQSFRLAFPASRWLSWPAYQKARHDSLGYATLPLSVPLFVLICPLAVVRWRKWRRNHDPSDLAHALGVWATHVASRIDRFYHASSRPRLLLAVRLVSLLLAILLGGLWLQSHRGLGHYNALFHRGTALVCYVEDGWLCLCRDPLVVPAWGIKTYGVIEWRYGTAFYTREYHFGRLPLGIPTFFFLSIAAYPLIPPVRRMSRKRRGLCARCGYDLTGNKTGRCPECFEPIAAMAPSPEIVHRPNPMWLRLSAAALVFVFAFIVAALLVGSLAERLEGMGLLRRIPENVETVVILAALLVLAYVPCRFVYFALHWRRVERDHTADEA
jgi:hypothetical protein